MKLESILNIGSNYISKFGNRAITGIIAIIIIDSLSKTDYGIYTFFTSMLVFFYILSTIGIRSALRRFVPQFSIKINPFRIYSILFPIILSLNVFWLMIIYTLYYFNPDLFNIENFGYYILIFSGVIIFQVQNQIIDILFKAFLLHRIVNFILLAILFTKLLLLSVYLGDVLTIEILFILDFGLYFIYYIVVLFLLKRRKISKKKSTSLEKKILKSKQFRQFSAWSFLQESGGSVLDVSMDIIIISVLLSELDMANYGFATKIISLLFLVIPTATLHDYINPIVYRKYSEKKDNFFLGNMFSLLNKISLIFAIPICVFILFFSKEYLIYFFDGKYKEVSFLLILICTFQLFNTFQYSISTVLNAIKQVKYFTYVRIFAVYNIIMDIVLIKFIGIEGAAIATGTTIMFSNIYLFIMAKKYISIDFRYLDFLKIFIAFIPLILITNLLIYFNANVISTAILFSLATIFMLLYIFKTNNIITLTDKKLLKILMN